jgi:phospholipase/carboxylesterase
VSAPADPSEIVHRLRPAAGDPEGAIVLFHGRGADEHDLEPVLDYLDPERRLVGATPRGPLSVPPGGAHWYMVRRVGFPDPDTFDPVLAQASGWLDGLLVSLGVPHERTVVGGFSQGAVMAYALGLGAGRPAPAGVLALSGFVPTVEGFELDPAGHADVPVAIGHGTEDAVIGVDFGRDARERLEGAGLDVTYRESPMGHSIDPDYLTELAGWVTRAVERGSAGARS